MYEWMSECPSSHQLWCFCIFFYDYYYHWGRLNCLLLYFIIILYHIFCFCFVSFICSHYCQSQLFFFCSVLAIFITFATNSLCQCECVFACIKYSKTYTRSYQSSSLQIRVFYSIFFCYFNFYCQMFILVFVFVCVCMCMFTTCIHTQYYCIDIK